METAFLGVSYWNLGNYLIYKFDVTLILENNLYENEVLFKKGCSKLGLSYAAITLVFLRGLLFLFLFFNHRPQLQHRLYPQKLRIEYLLLDMRSCIQNVCILKDVNYNSRVSCISCNFILFHVSFCVVILVIES